MTILNDKAIAALQENDLFMPYFGSKQRQNERGGKAISFGLSQCGYDISLSDKQFIVYDRSCYQPEYFTLDPKDEVTGRQVPLNRGEKDAFFVLPSQSFGLGISRELISMPDHVFAICQGKSTYGRCGLIANILPIEPGWTGHLTMCLVNTAPFPMRIYVNEGIAQVIFYDCGQVGEAYSGHYQNQGAMVTTAAV